jgi:hypothetical protein
MYRFGECYGLARSMLGRKCFQKWSSVYQTRLEALFGEAGPDENHAKVLGDIQFYLGSPGAPPPVKHQPMIRLRNADKTPPRMPTDRQFADILIDTAKASLEKPTEPFHDQCALLKMLKHFYFVSRAGSQSIWVADNPAAYTEWPFNVLGGKSERQIRDALMHNTEVIGADNRKLLSDAFAVARKWSMDAYAKTSAPDAKTIDLVKRWFGVGRTDNLESVVKWVSMSFGWISEACNSKHVIFADHPVYRTEHRHDLPIASTAYGKDEALRVVSIYRPFFKYKNKDRNGSMPKLWLAALTIVHELAHKEVGVDDKRYDYKGIKPGPHLPPEDAIWNADSYGYFAADLAGALSQSDFRAVYK